MYYAYILKCGDGSFFVGQTDNLDSTVTKHKEGYGSGLTAHRLPVELVYYEQFESMDEAHKRHIQFAKWRRAHKLSMAESGAMTLPNASAREACQRNRP